MVRHKGISIPEPLYNYVEKLVKDERVIEKYGFTSVAQFTKRALEELIRTIEEEISSLRLKPSEGGADSDSESGFK